MRESDRAVRLAVFFGIVLTIVGVAFVVGAVVSPAAPGFDQTEGYEYDIEAMQPDVVPADGQVDVDVEADGVLLIDDAHMNRFEREDIRSLTGAATEAGFEVRFLRDADDIETELEEAEAFVVVDPSFDYENDTAEAVGSFVDDGGRLLIVGEPNRGEVRVAGPVAEVATVRSETTTLASQFGISFGTEYLYNLEESDGNYRNVIATPTPWADFAEDADRVVLSTATHVETRDGTILLTTTPGTQRSGARTQGEYAVAVRDGNVLAVGDKTFLGPERHVVADNEILVAEIVEFLAEG